VRAERLHQQELERLSAYRGVAISHASSSIEAGRLVVLAPRSRRNGDGLVRARFVLVQPEIR